jgi:hypothetical protein
MRYCLLVLSAFIVIASCKKVETPQSMGDKLRASEWTLDNGTQAWVAYNGDDSLLEGLWPPDYKRPDCLKDDYLKFGANHDGNHITGPNKCGTSETSDIQFQWGLTDNDKKIYMYGLYSLMGQDVNGDFRSISDEKMSVTYIMKSTGASASKRITMIFKKK